MGSRQCTTRHTDYIDGIGAFGAWCANKEVVRFDITINKRLVVDCLHTGKLVKRRWPRPISDQNTREPDGRAPPAGATNAPSVVPTYKRI